MLSLVAGTGAFVLMWAYGHGRIAVITVVSAALVLGGISFLLLLVNGIATVASAKGEDFFVVYTLPASVALAVGAAMGNAVANRR